MTSRISCSRFSTSDFGFPADRTDCAARAEVYVLTGRITAARNFPGARTV